MGERWELEGYSPVDELGRPRASLRSRAWIGFWLSAVLVTAGVMAVSHAPSGAYAILLVVVTVMLSARSPARRHGAMVEPARDISQEGRSGIAQP